MTFKGRQIFKLFGNHSNASNTKFSKGNNLVVKLPDVAAVRVVESGDNLKIFGIKCLRPIFSFCLYFSWQPNLLEFLFYSLYNADVTNKTCVRWSELPGFLSHLEDIKVAQGLGFQLTERDLASKGCKWKLRLTLMRLINELDMFD